MKTMKHMIEQHTDSWPTGLVDAEFISNKIGISSERILYFAKNRLCPHYIFDGDVILFKIIEFKTWAANNILEKCEGESLPIKVTVVENIPKNVINKPPECLYPISSQLRQIQNFSAPCGVYFLCKDDAVVYVGQSINPLSRVYSHINCKDFDRAYWIPVPDDQLDEVEGALIRHLAPPQNGRGYSKNGNGKLVAPVSQNKDRILAELGFTNEPIG